jgi:hypothetical protein
MIDYISNCLSNLINIFVYKLINQKPVLLELAKTDHLFLPILNKQSESICLNDLFEIFFNVNRTLFNSFFKLS